MKQLPHSKLTRNIFVIALIMAIIAILMSILGINDKNLDIYFYLLLVLSLGMYSFLADSYKNGAIYEFYSKGGIAHKPSWSFYFQFFIDLALSTFVFVISLYGIILKYFG